MSGTLEKPTFSLNIGINTYGRECHSKIADGKIQFFNCWHGYKGRVVPMVQVSGLLHNRGVR
jgi:hypothetical protein